MIYSLKQEALLEDSLVILLIYQAWLQNKENDFTITNENSSCCSMVTFLISSTFPLVRERAAGFSE